MSTFQKINPSPFSHLPKSASPVHAAGEPGEPSPTPPAYWSEKPPNNCGRAPFFLQMRLNADAISQRCGCIGLKDRFKITRVADC
jgi:hypothetical protein